MVFKLLARCWQPMLALALLGAVTQVHAVDTAGRVIVRLKSDASVLRSSVVQAQSRDASASSHVMQRLGQRRGLQVQDGRELGPYIHVARAQGMSSQALAAALSKDSDVLYAVPDRLRRLHAVPDDPLFSDVNNPNVAVGQWFLRAPDASIVSAINAQAAWTRATGLGITVAAVDSGVRMDHPDLQGKLGNGYNMISYASVSGSGGGRSTDPSDLGDWVDQSGIQAISAEVGGTVDCAVQASSSWHGTEVAGIIGARTHNAIGGASVAPDAMVLPVRALGKCGGWDSDIIAGMRWAVGLPVGGVNTVPSPVARVINLSLGGGDSCSQAYQDVIAEITARNVVIVASAGNDNGLAVSTPANCDGVIAVAGVRHAGNKVGYSSLGPQVALSAPAGNCVNEGGGPCLYTMLTTTNAGTTTPQTDANHGSTYTDSYNRWANGTSFAAPQVSGTVAMMLEARPSLTPAAVSSILRRHARRFPSSLSGSCVAPSDAEQLECDCTTQTCGAGMLDADASVQAAMNDPVAVITISAQAPQAHQVVTLDGTRSMSSPAGSQVVGYTWQIVNDGGIVNATAWSSTAHSVQLTPTGSGAFQVRLQVQDDVGRSAYIDQWVYVSPSSTTGSTSSSGGGGGGGGGSIDGCALFFLGLIACALTVLRLERPVRAGASFLQMRCP